MRSSTVVALLLGFSACVDTPPLAEVVVEATHVEIKMLPASHIPKADVLIVLDDTIAMSPYQDRMAALPAKLADHLTSIGGGWADLRIAVTTNAGWMRRLPGSEDSFLADALDFDFTPRKNYTGSVADALAVLMDVGAVNAGPHQPLEAMRRALERNSQFVRDDASLAVIMISATDDASPWPVSDYVSWTEAATRGTWTRRLVLAAIHPPAASRLDEYYGSLAPSARGRVTSIDDGDYEGALEALRSVPWGSYWGMPCLEETLFDVDASAPGTQYDCSVSVTINDELRALPRCEEPRPHVEQLDPALPGRPRAACWSLRPDPWNCSFTGDHMRLHFSGYAVHPEYRLECRTR